MRAGVDGALHPPVSDWIHSGELFTQADVNNDDLPCLVWTIIAGQTYFGATEGHRGVSLKHRACRAPSVRVQARG